MEVPETVNKRLAIAIATILLLFGVAWRLTPHIPNFAPIGAIALVAGMTLGWRISLLLTIAILTVSDFIIGLYPGMEWTWLGFGLIIGLGLAIKHLPLPWRLPIGALGASSTFFLVSNFGTWLTSGMYSHDLAGLLHCFTMALPFFRATVSSDLLFTAALLAAYEVLRLSVAGSMLRPSEHQSPSYPRG